MVQELRHYWHSTMANAPKDGEENFSGSMAWGLGPQLLPQRRGNEKTGSAGRRLAKTRVNLAGVCRKLWAEGSQDVYLVHAALCFLQGFFSSGLSLVRAGLVLLFIFESCGVSAYSTLPTSRLLHYYFLGSRETEAN